MRRWWVKRGHSPWHARKDAAVLKRPPKVEPTVADDVVVLRHPIRTRCGRWVPRVSDGRADAVALLTRRPPGACKLCLRGIKA